MGCASSTFIVSVSIPGQGNEVLTTASSLHYEKKDIDGLWGFFQKRLTKEYPHEILISDLTCVSEMENSVLGELLFRLFSRGHRDRLNFCQFISACWHILTLKEDRDVAILLFIILDTDNTGFLRLEEAKFMVNLLDNFHRDEV